MAPAPPVLESRAGAASAGCYRVRPATTLDPHLYAPVSPGDPPRYRPCGRAASLPGARREQPARARRGRRATALNRLGPPLPTARRLYAFRRRARPCGPRSRRWRSAASHDGEQVVSAASRPRASAPPCRSRQHVGGEVDLDLLRRHLGLQLLRAPSRPSVFPAAAMPPASAPPSPGSRCLHRQKSVSTRSTLVTRREAPGR